MPLTCIILHYTIEQWAEIAKRIPGRNESSVKNRWYNVKTTEKKAKQKAEQALRESLEAELAAAGDVLMTVDCHSLPDNVYGAKHV